VGSALAVAVASASTTDAISAGAQTYKAALGMNFGGGYCRGNLSSVGFEKQGVH